MAESVLHGQGACVALWTNLNLYNSTTYFLWKPDGDAVLEAWVRFSPEGYYSIRLSRLYDTVAVQILKIAPQYNEPSLLAEGSLYNYDYYYPDEPEPVQITLDGGSISVRLARRPYMESTGCTEPAIC
jgi:hypothetical protein